MQTPTIEDIVDADKRIRPHAVETPLLEFGTLNEKLGGRILCKVEALQRTGSFKFRGAYNRVSRVDRQAFPGGVVACSSGNHAQGVAEAARLCEIDAAIVMPSDAPQIKIARTSASGADIVFYDRETEDREAIARDLCQKLDADFIAPFNDPYVIAGQGTVGLELARQAEAAGAKLDAVLAPASGGGLVAGVALAVKDRVPEAEIYSVEPRGFDDLARSLAAGKRVRNESGAKSICDALLMPEPGELTFALNKDRLAGGLVVSDADVRHAVAYAWRDLKLVLEPGGAVALAALLSGALDVEGRTVAIVLSGGNVDAHLFAEIIADNRELASPRHE
ncbi:threonine ammonia-lyase [Rhodomicrobium lacus]|uniref:threonine ammonia-lyase n=1 Tax=Rhodomicrobium lacus TaxID=2498452 RepID=UPI0026E2C012|nr:threonine/serine dehydratase [Rhodomicrobium lacus]WKW50515.1 threonine/serine dehydratase [Rhodomicrobium lacus]